MFNIFKSLKALLDPLDPAVYMEREKCQMSMIVNIFMILGIVIGVYVFVNVFLFFWPLIFWGFVMMGLIMFFMAVKNYLTRR